mmetsp:Transcript_27369/g.84044  ORF Transcript_27369/g.84044 Transcript_27369/m.84044 type:complete len:106 (-) Transcript_27369:44-361(-)
MHRCAVVELEFNASSEHAFYEAVRACSFLGDVSRVRIERRKYHVVVSAPRIWRCCLEMLPSHSAFPGAFEEFDVQVAAGYEAPSVDILKLDDGRVLLDVETYRSV